MPLDLSMIAQDDWVKYVAVDDIIDTAKTVVQEKIEQAMLSSIDV